MVCAYFDHETTRQCEVEDLRRLFDEAPQSKQVHELSQTITHLQQQLSTLHANLQTQTHFMQQCKTEHQVEVQNLKKTIFALQEKEFELNEIKGMYMLQSLQEQQQQQLKEPKYAAAESGE